MSSTATWWGFSWSTAATARGPIAWATKRDQLTGLASRQEPMAHLEAAVRDGRRACVHYVDLDDSKLVNDTLGHGAGDELLCHVAAAMEALARPGDMLARQGGDEFVLAALRASPPSQLVLPGAAAAA
ncbi:MAG TPA: GGDEF domain-containing protein [Acidimicrobiales bacterium]